MSDLRIIVPHSLPTDEAVLRVKRLVERLRAEYANKIDGMDETWQADSAAISLRLQDPIPVNISANLLFTPTEVTVQGHLPWLASLFRAKIEGIIRSHLSGCLS